MLARLIEQLGGDPSYISPTARLAQIKAEKLLKTSLVADGLSQPELEAKDLENVLLAETKDRADWSLLAELARQVEDARIKQALEQAVGEVESEEDEHLEWARETLAQLSLRLVLESPAPPPERWQRVISGPEPPIDQIHPAPIMEGLLKPAQQEPWQASTTTRTMQAQR